jgi:hypothetical protein
MLIAGSAAAVILAIVAGICAHRSVGAAPAAQPAQAAPAVPASPAGDSASPSASGGTPYEEAPEPTPTPGPMWGTSAAQQQEILSRVSGTAADWAASLFSRTWSDGETAYITNTALYQTAAMTQSEKQYEATPPARMNWKQLREQQCTVTLSSPLAVPPDNYTADYPGPHIPSLNSQWQVVVFATDATCKYPSPSLPPVPSVSYERLVRLVPAKAGHPDGAWVVTGAYSTWDDTSQSGAVFGAAGGPSSQPGS